MIPFGPLRLLPQVRAAEKDNTQFKTFIHLFKLFKNSRDRQLDHAKGSHILNFPLVFSPSINAHEIIMKGDMAL